MKRIPILSETEIAHVIDAIHSYRCLPHRKPILVALYTLIANLGLRVSEALAVRWQDCDFDRAEITIRTLKQQKRKNGAPQIIEDTLPLNAVTMTALRQVKNGVASHERIFPTISRRVAYNIFQRLLHYAGIPPVKLHALRHSAVTRWVECTQDLAFAQAMARHRSVASTAKYVHCTKMKEKFLKIAAVGGILVAVCLLGFSAEAADWTWRPADTVREATWMTLHVLDWGQTLEVARHPVQFYERSPWLGKHPSVGEVNAFMGMWVVLHPIIASALPHGWRDVWQYVTIGTTGYNVVTNFSVGLRVRF